MATTVARLEAVLSADTRSFDRSMDRSNSKMGRAGKAAGVVGAAIGGLLVAGSVRAIRAASDLNEEIDKSKVVFGKASREVLKWSGGTASSLGLSQRMALQAAGAYGNMFKTIGLGDAPAAAMSKRMVTLAADMASFSNEDPSEMLRNLQSGLAGQSEPLRKFGVLLSEGRVKTEAYKMGIAEVGAVLTEQEKVQARYSLIVKDSAIQHGNFELTSKSLANQERILKAQLEDLSAKLGTALIPAMQSVVAVFIVAAGWFAKHQTAAKILVVGLGILATALLAAAAAQLLLNLAFLANPVGLVVIAIAALAAGIILAYRRSETFREIVNALWEVFKNVTPIGLLIKHFGTLSDSVQSVYNWVRKAIDAIQDMIRWIGKIKLPSIDLPNIIPGRGDPPGGGLGGVAGGSLVSVGRQLQSQGYQVGEHPAFGGVSGAHTPTSYHYRGRAIDVNWAGGGFGELHALQRIYPALSNMRHAELMIEDIGRQNQHLHFAMDRGGIVPGRGPKLGVLHGGETVLPTHKSPTILAPIYIGGQHVVDVVFDLVRGKAQVYERRNSRPAFG